MITLSSDLHLAESVEEALSLTERLPGALLLAGGTSAFADVGPAGSQRRPIVSIRRLPELQGIGVVDGALRIGANTLIADLLTDPTVREQAPVIASSARSLASRLVRNRATIGGNICTARADHTMVPGLLALGAAVRGRTKDGAEWNTSLEAFLLERGVSAEAPLVTSVSVPIIRGFQKYTRVGARNGPCYATASVALVVDPQERTVRIALGNAAPTAIRMGEAEDLANDGVDWENLRSSTALNRAVADSVSQYCDPVSDTFASAQYRRHAVGVMTRRLLEEAFEEAS